ncbi:MAG: hypothetical protein EBU93_02590 [Chlamydiae bacterium]|jgi:hypothetical protein|nr:hypothetical protein [Chlamydiota bacterium]
MSAGSIPPYKPGDDFSQQPLSNENIDELQKKLEACRNVMKGLSGFDAIFYFYNEMVPLQMDIQSASMNLISNQVDALTNYSAFTSILKQEFQESNPANTGSKDWTSIFNKQLGQLKNAILTDPRFSKEDAQNFVGVIDQMLSLSQAIPLPTIWSQANPPAGQAPNASNLKIMLKGFDQTSSTAQSMSQVGQAKMQYYLDEYKKYMNFFKQSVKTITDVNNLVVTQMGRR